MNTLYFASKSGRDNIFLNSILTHYSIETTQPLSVRASVALRRNRALPLFDGKVEAEERRLGKDVEKKYIQNLKHPGIWSFSYSSDPAPPQCTPN